WPRLGSGFRMSDLSYFEGHARSAWNRDPLLRHVFVDFCEFFQQYVVTKHLTDTSAALDAWHAEHAEYALQARARAVLGRYPTTSSARPVIAERRGARLILWLAGPITPFQNIAPAITLKVIEQAIDDHHDASLIVLRIDSPGGSAMDA